MRTKSKYTQDDIDPFWFWNWKGKKMTMKKKEFPVTKYLRDSGWKAKEAMLEPGGGIGIGCGGGVGFGVVGGIGYGGWPWNHIQVVFGVGMGCGVGVGFGYGQGIGYGISLDSLKAHLSDQISD